MEMKLVYKMPEAELLFVQFECNILSGESSSTGESYDSQTGEENMDDWS